MNFEGFHPGVWRQQYRYKSFSPVPVNHDWSWQDASTRCSSRRPGRWVN